MSKESHSKRMDEFSLIRFLTGHRPTDSKNVPVGIGDDAAVVSFSPGKHVVACCDAMVETVHFARQTLSPYDIGYKALAVNISDVAAMGGIPRFYLVTLSIAPHWTDEELNQLYQGMYHLADQYHMQLIGGDTVATPGQTEISVTVLGEIEPDQAITRSGARVGDRVFVTGPVGSSAAGLDQLLRNGREIENRAEWLHPLLVAHQRPTPQVAAGRICAKAGSVHALNDISDGLASEAWEMAEASKVRLVLEEKKIPVMPEMIRYAKERAKNPQDWICYGGEDFQLIGTVAESKADALQAAFTKAGLTLSFIGWTEAGIPRVDWVNAQGQRESLAKKGYNHFT